VFGWKKKRNDLNGLAAQLRPDLSAESLASDPASPASPRTRC